MSCQSKLKTCSKKQQPFGITEWLQLNNERAYKMSESKQETVSKVINSALRKMTVPTVGAQKVEYYKAGIRDFVKLVQVEIDRLESTKGVSK